MKLRITVRWEVLCDLLGVFGEDNVREMLREYEVIAAQDE
jgi:hypothetical protein